jgi:hypothetical protein
MIHHPEFTPAPITEIPGPDLFMTVIMVSDWAASLYRGTIFIGNVDTNRINHDRIEWHGSTPKGIEQPDFVWSEDNWFRPVDIELGPDACRKRASRSARPRSSPPCRPTWPTRSPCPNSMT